MTKKKKAPAAKKGRPSSYRDEYAKQAYKLCLLGATDKEMADFFGCSTSTLNLWKIDHPDFSESIKGGKLGADANVAKALYRRAIGYTHPEEKIFCVEGAIVRANTTKHYPPDTMAGMYWLNNRQASKYRRSPPEGFGEDEALQPVKIVVEVKDARRNADA